MAMTPAIRPIVAGNWKMNGLRNDGLALAREIVRRARRAEADELGAELVLCPPATLLTAVAEVVAGSPVCPGGQDCHSQPSGAHTGDLSASMLADAGCRYVILGHSERRAAHGETDAIVRAKAEAAHAAGLIAIVCVGESEAQRLADQTLAIVEGQFRGSLPASASAANTVVAYEPVWAIGTGRVPTEAEIALVHGQLRGLARRHLRHGDGLRLLYGGSVKPGNARELMAIDNVNGALVGGASLKADDFWSIAQSCPWPSRHEATK